MFSSDDRTWLKIAYRALAVLAVVTVLMGVSSCGSGSGGSNSTPPAAVALLSATSITFSSQAVGTTSAARWVTLNNTGNATLNISGISLGGTNSTDFSETNTCGASVSAGGSCSISVTFRPATTGSLSASVAIVDNASGSPQSIALTGTGALAATTTLVPSAAVSVQGLPVELTATVTPGSGTAIPTGRVSFMNGASSLGTVALDFTGRAVFTTTLLGVGSDSLTATYWGDAMFAPSTSPATSVTIQESGASTYTNPLTLNVSNGVTAVSCADPAIIKTQSSGTDTWYLYCTEDALYSGDRTPHYINIFDSQDLVTWKYVGNAFSAMPSWAQALGATYMWAPAIKYMDGEYYLYYATDTSSSGGSAIGVGTSLTPQGPFTDHGSPVVAPVLTSSGYRTTIDPDEIQDSTGQRYILFGGYGGGIFVRTLSADGFTTDPVSEVQIASDNRYEGGNWWVHGGYYYLLASSSNCCNGPLSGYGVFAGRATSPMGPYLDANGVAMTAMNPGGTPVLTMNGNTFVGPGGNVVFTDESGQDYILYHAINRNSPYYSGNVGYTARHVLLDALDWVNGWPVTRGGYGPSDNAAPQPKPAAQPGQTGSYSPQFAANDVPGPLVTSLSDDFNSTALGSQWSFIHGQPPYTLTGSAYEVQSVGYDTVDVMANVPLLAEPAPATDYVVETKVTLDLPTLGNASYPQAGLIIYGDDSNYLREDLFSNGDTRQVEFIKAETPPASGYPTWGKTNLGPPALVSGVWQVWMRIVKRTVNGQENYTAYSSADGITWVRGGTWVHSLGNSEKICLFAGNQAGYTADFDYVHVSLLR